MTAWIFRALSLIAGALVACFTYDGGILRALLLFSGTALGTLLLLHLLFAFLLFLITRFIRDREPTRDHPFLYRFTRAGIGWLLVLLRVRVSVTGKELLPLGNAVFVSDHLSNFDPLVAIPAFRKRRFVFLSKESNLRIPIAGRFMRVCNILPLDRENPRSAVKTLNRAAELFGARGYDIAVYPEGRRAGRGPHRPFQEGAFYIAKKCASPIVLFTTEGTELFSLRSLFIGCRVRLRVIGVISEEEVAALSVKELAARSQNAVYAALGVDTAALQTEN